LSAFNLGNLTTTFTLPDYRSRSPMGAGQGSGLTKRYQGSFYGAETHTLTTDELPAHSHANGAFDRLLRVTGLNTAANLDNSAVEPDVVTTGAIASVGNNVGHNNIQPSFAENWFVYSGV
jgi:microcystin-dependent protein